MSRPNHGRLARSWLLASAIAAALPFTAQAQSLALNQALARAAQADPTRAAAEARIKAADAGARQADVRANPVLGVELEDLTGTGPYSLVDRAQATFYYQQTLERGGKREARTALARTEIDLVRLRHQTKVLDLFKEVELAWVEALAAEAQARLARTRLDIAERAQAEVDRRVKMARDPLFAGARAEAQVAEARIALSQAQLAADTARRTLAGYWNDGVDFEIDAAALEDTSAAREIAGEASPVDLALLDAERQTATARVRVEETKAVQDPTWRAGLRYLNEGRDVAVVVGGSIPLARYDTNRGAIERAQAERTAADTDLLTGKVLRERQIAKLQADLTARASEARRIEAEVLPAAERTIALVREGFNRGGFSYLDVIEAQQVLIDARSRRLDALKAFHTDRALLARLTGRHAALIPASETVR
ncbi:TolC family protein [Caulobacter henricii]|uniref:Metal transporter n=1 Tax=Caulobacter henricii TaxID=69395 RepID=A0A0P0NZA3_9CAUL|nr:TolC family protein [Caulobacter henricii]ALL13199.1 metal transporter [Caulobacter henricii]